ncbi:MAG TPA: FKBP-type peptidyl-prolyl cis-trans isomerase [Longimicrobiales bacterium]
MRIVLTAAVLFLTACDSPSEPDDRWAVPEDITFAASLGVDLAEMTKTESGLYWQDITVGTGADSVDVEDDVSFHLTIWLPDGRSVYTTRNGAPEMNAVRLLIPGLAEGMLAMRRDGVRKLVIRPELAWPNGRPDFDIPPITTIVCEVQLMSIS